MKTRLERLENDSVKPQKVKKLVIIDGAIKAHEKALVYCQDLSTRFKNSATFPDVSPREDEKAIRIKQILAELRDPKLVVKMTSVQPGAVAVVRDSRYGIKYYLILRSTECDHFKIERPSLDINIALAAHFNLRQVGQKQVRLQGRPGEELEETAELLYIF